MCRCTGAIRRFRFICRIEAHSCLPLCDRVLHGTCADPASARVENPCYDSYVLVRDLGTIGYREAWAIQEQAHADVLAGGEEQLLIVEHPPVITFGRRPGLEK